MKNAVGARWSAMELCRLPTISQARRCTFGSGRHVKVASQSTSRTLPPHILLKPKLSYVGVRASEGMSSDKQHWGGKFEGMTIAPPPLTKPDESFHSMGLEFLDTKDGIVLTELNDLFEKVGFPKREPAKLVIALQNTHALVWVRSTKQSRYARKGQMVAFARATSDGVFSATIWDVSVLPAWQRSGLGRAMMERLTRRLVEDNIPTISLYAEPTVVGLYERLGFVRDPEGIKGMAFQRRKKEKHGSVVTFRS